MNKLIYDTSGAYKGFWIANGPDLRQVEESDFGSIYYVPYVSEVIILTYE